MTTQDDEILNLRSQLQDATERFASGAWLDDVADQTRVAGPDAFVRAARLLFEQEYSQLERLRSELGALIEKRKFDLRVGLRTGTTSYDTRLWKVTARATVEYDLDKLAADYPDLPDGAIKVSTSLVKRKVPAHVRLDDYERERSVTYAITYAGQTWGSDDDAEQ